MYLQGQNGLLPTFKVSWRNRGPVGILAAALLIGFYLVLYFEDNLFAYPGPLTQFSQAVGLRNKWFVYGALYSIGMVAGGTYYLLRHGNSRYNRFRIAVNIFVQVCFGFSFPFFAEALSQPEFYFGYFWPLKFEYLFPSKLAQLPLYMVLYTTLGSLVVMPILSIAFGKRWYCSWICGCGALANTFGDPWRHLTASSTASWKFEKVAIHTVMFIAIAATLIIALGVPVNGAAVVPQLGSLASAVSSWYFFVVSSILAGVIGTGLYPILGPRVWCRNFCPMAAMIGVFHKLGRFRITVKPNMCISCGNCTTYCEMGIDVRSYAQSNQTFTRASCVGCGMCAHMCPRGVLRLENTATPQADKRRQALRVIDF